MKQNGYKPIRFDHRAMIVNPDADESFDMEKWERGEAVSISGLTNAFSDIITSNGGVCGCYCWYSDSSFIDPIRSIV